ncbi:NAD(P)-dependent alcohol dehydrogenase [Sphingomonas sp. TREG-RG-20F-R18-01]|uniref:zinc-dependent alcohol dehydrogenase family protein n=1 Tax=Sphingomonas sp. TREG-RG-20F-R18-01 TaxID=2914982 RepID=UPI001F579882|nr:NAD(P)-dependent alcohol dehydrogenase [Sphingomonas sp. TREG-RG-20F-R18-01]
MPIKACSEELARRMPEHLPAQHLSGEASMNITTQSPSTATVRAFELSGFGYDHVGEVRRPDRQVGPGEVRVRMRAASINYRDHVVITGRYGIPESALPFVPISDGAGEVVEAGSGVERVRVGDRVTTLMTRDWISGPLRPDRHAAQNGGPLDGVLAESVVLPERAVSHFADYLDFDEAATLPIAALTAYTSIVESGVGPGDTMLVTGSGGVSIFTLQLAKLFGTKVVITTGQLDARGPRLRALGADLVLDYGTSDWPQAVLAATGGRGADAVMETGGLSAFAQVLAALRQNGFVALVGFRATTGGMVPDVTFPLLTKNVRLSGIAPGNRDGYEALQRVLDQSRLRPVIDSRFPFADSAAALDHAINGRPFGKVVITFP